MTSFNNQEWAKKNFNDCVVSELIVAPHTTIQNRAKIENAPLKPLMGVERIIFSAAELVDNEFSPDGSSVYKADDKVRFYGKMYSTSYSDYSGTRPLTDVGAYTEVTFYGTGLNLLTTIDSSARDIRMSIDGGAESDNLTFVGSAILNARYYNPNQILNVCKELALGWHTVLFRQVTSTFNWYGIEILNESTMKINAGSAFSGMNKDMLPAITDTDYRAGVVGVNGARVLKYLKDGIIGQAITEVGSPLYLANTNHNNEEIVRKINWREFGRNRSDDFSTLSTAPEDRVFTLADNITTLVGHHVDHDDNGVKINATTGFLIITFIGTGLDIYNHNDSNIMATTVIVDGTTISTGTGALSGVNNIKICSGLPYGTHTVKILRDDNSGSAPRIEHFIIYGPKKPTLPENAIEIADYNVLADFIFNSTFNEMSTGTIAKMNSREHLYIGSSWNWILAPTAGCSGGRCSSTAIDNEFKSTFFGTGWALTGFVGVATSNRVYINGLLATIANFPTLTFIAKGNAVWDNTTGVVTASADSYGYGYGFKGLSLGKHEIRIVNQSSAQYVSCQWLEIIAPIHVNNTSIGNLSLSDSRSFSAVPRTETGEVDWGKAKAIIYYDGATNELLSSKNIAQVIDHGVGVFRIYFSKVFKNTNYIAAGLAEDAAYYLQTYSSAKNPNQYRVSIRNADGASADSKFTLVFFGELEGE